MVQNSTALLRDRKIRAVHACWDNRNIDLLRHTLDNDKLIDTLIYKSVKKGTPLNKAIDDAER